jgi:polysaccharide biosynthesis protein PslH
MMGGGAMRSASLLHYLAREHEVDLVAFRQPGAPHPGDLLPPGLVRHTLVLELPPHRRGAAARAWRNAGRLARSVPPLIDRFAGFGTPLELFLGDTRYDVAVIEHFWCAPYARQLAGHTARLLLDLHNVESTLHARCAAAETGPAAVAHRVFERACRELEREWLPRFSALLVASEPDAEQVRLQAPRVPVLVYPNALPAAPAPPRREEHVVVFSGNLEYHPNISAVRFFRRHIWPRLASEWPELKWRLVGKNPQAVSRYTSGDARIEVTGEVPDAVGCLARAQAAVVPLLAGSGTRFKILEAWAARTPVVSTRLGAEGLPARDGENLLLADDPGDFAAAVSRLLRSPDLRRQLGGCGRAVLERRFTWEIAWQQLDA